MARVSRIPIIRLYGNLIVSIQGSLSDKLVNQLQDDLTEAVERSDVQGLIVDVSGVDVMDSYISRALRDIGVIVRLMGVSTVISGMHPIIAMTLVQMGLDLKGMRAALNLESAIEMLADERREQAAFFEEMAG